MDKLKEMEDLLGMSKHLISFSDLIAILKWQLLCGLHFDVSSVFSYGFVYKKLVEINL